jgi:LysR family transcriptional activator of mexEF-oprN operon
MSRLELAEVDLNLLKAFDALCREGSVTKAAERLALGQPAMSHALSRLRELLGDELFVKTPRGMEPTARARALMRPVRTALADLAHALNDGGEFDPMTEQWRARLGMPAFVAAAVLPALLPAVSHTAPAVSFEVQTMPARRLGGLLDDGELDVVVAFDLPEVPWHRRRLLVREPHRCIFNGALLSISAPITLEEFLAFPHIAVSPQGDPVSPIDVVLRELGKGRRVLASTSDFLLVGYVLRDVPAIATLPASFAQRCSLTAGLEVSPLPFDFEECEITVSWHARDEASAKHRWLRELIASTIAATLEGSGFLGSRGAVESGGSWGVSPLRAHEKRPQQAEENHELHASDLRG